MKNVLILFLKISQTERALRKNELLFKKKRKASNEASFYCVFCLYVIFYDSHNLIQDLLRDICRYFNKET